MSSLHKFCALLLGTLLITTVCTAQVATKTTILLMRHAEKELTGTDPDLSAKGKKRAARLPIVLSSYKPDAFYSTDTRRTRQTVAPWAGKLRERILIYDAAQQHLLAAQLKASRRKTIVVVGHSNTIPGLANLILGTDTYSDLPETEFGKIWIVTIRNGKASAVVTTY